MRARNPKFLSSAPKIFGLTLNELGITAGIFYLSNFFISEQFISMGVALVALMILVKLRAYPSFHFINAMLKDDHIKLNRVEEPSHEDR